MVSHDVKCYAKKRLKNERALLHGRMEARCNDLELPIVNEPSLPLTRPKPIAAQDGPTFPTRCACGAKLLGAVVTSPAEHGFRPIGKENSDEH